MSHSEVDTSTSHQNESSSETGTLSKKDHTPMSQKICKYPGIESVIHGNGAVAHVMGHVCGGVIGYPITPSTEIVERMSKRLPLVGGLFVQMEDEIASSIAIQGAVWGGKKYITVSSGPGISRRFS